MQCHMAVGCQPEPQEAYTAIASSHRDTNNSLCSLCMDLYLFAYDCWPDVCMMSLTHRAKRSILAFSVSAAGQMSA